MYLDQSLHTDKQYCCSFVEKLFILSKLLILNKQHAYMNIWLEGEEHIVHGGGVLLGQNLVWCRHF